MDCNMRDYASLNELLVLANMESYNAVLIGKGMDQKERMIELRKLARTQLMSIERLDNTGIKSLEEGTKKQRGMFERGIKNYFIPNNIALVDTNCFSKIYYKSQWNDFRDHFFSGIYWSISLLYIKRYGNWNGSITISILMGYLKLHCGLQHTLKQRKIH